MGRAQDEQRADRARHHALIAGPDRREHAVHMREPGGRGDGEANDEVIEKAQTHSVAPRAPISAQTLCTELRYWVVRRENSGSSWGPGLDALAAPAAMIQNRPARRLLPTPMSKLRGVAPLIPRAVARVIGADRRAVDHVDVAGPGGRSVSRRAVRPLREAPAHRLCRIEIEPIDRSSSSTAATLYPVNHMVSGPAAGKLAVRL